MELSDCAIRDIKAGKNVRIIRPSNIYQCELQDNVFVGPFVEIQKGCVIGRDSRIQSHTFICENVTLGERCFIGHNVSFANDLFKSGAPDPTPENWINITLGGENDYGKRDLCGQSGEVNSDVVGIAQEEPRYIFRIGILQRVDYPTRLTSPTSKM